MAEKQVPIQPAPVAQQPTAPGAPVYKQMTAVTGTENWTSDIFDCFTGEDNLFLKAWCCPCFVFGKTEARRRDPSLASYESINNDCLLWFGAHCCSISFILTFLKRQEIREEYHLKGDAVTDCLFSAFCQCCTLVQQEKEVIAKQREAGVTSQGYQAPAAMTTGQ
ncbi:hypothetical protein G7Y89_g12227 [Cudoniella acicularis]|uniref:PLAC8 family protein n=1 Tax=Cudoniella acicularis TaxID=354080 RepID=A0A8H4RAU9_9HELO|nr:hypothetical protein G7Y89_g12227 [Cudoniella acicularis]